MSYRDLFGTLDNHFFFLKKSGATKGVGFPLGAYEKILTGLKQPRHPISRTPRHFACHYVVRFLGNL